MSRILLQTTIPAHPDDWDITRFSLLADELRAAGHEVIARNRANRDDDLVLRSCEEITRAFASSSVFTDLVGGR
jgi:hypothetical protein